MRNLAPASSGPSVFSSISEVSVLLSVILLFRFSLLVSASNVASGGSERNPAMLILFTICWILKKDRSTSASSVERPGGKGKWKELLAKETPTSRPGSTWIKDLCYFQRVQIRKGKLTRDSSNDPGGILGSTTHSGSELVAKLQLLLHLALPRTLLHFSAAV